MSYFSIRGLCSSDNATISFQFLTINTILRLIETCYWHNNLVSRWIQTIEIQYSALSVSQVAQCSFCSLPVFAPHFSDLCHHSSLLQCTAISHSHGCVRTVNGYHWYNCKHSAGGSLPERLCNFPTGDLIAYTHLRPPQLMEKTKFYTF